MLARVVAWIGTAAGLVLIVVLVTGGFRFELGPVRVSAHNAIPSIVLMIAAGSLLFWGGGARDALSSIGDDLARHARGIAMVAAVAIAGVGIGFGTFAASSADPSAYVGHGALIAEGRLTIDAPLARAVDWHEATWTFTPLGYRPGSVPGILVPGYPLGLPLVMAAARRAGGEFAPYFVAPALAALAVLATYAIAARLGSPLAGVVAAVLLASSPIVQFQVVQPMSDVPAMAWSTLAAACALRRTPFAAASAGAAAGAAVMTRPSLVPLVLLVAAVAWGWPRTAPSSRLEARRVVAFLAGGFPFAILQIWLQHRLYGSLLQTGYGDISDFFAASNIWPNVGAYSHRLLTGEGPAWVLGIAALVALAVRRPSTPSPALAASCKLAAASTAILLAVYLPYGVFADWASLRFLLPALPLALAALGALVAAAVARVAVPARGVMLLTALALAVSVDVTHAAQQSAYALRDYEARYRTIGGYLAASLPKDAVIVTAQHSGSAHYYTGLPILRWDLLAVDLETATMRLRALGRRPVLVVEDWEKPALRQRFPSGPTASLDWPPRAETGATTRVGIWDPADRGRNVITDRLP
jgi:hypothetical protein